MANNDAVHNKADHSVLEVIHLGDVVVTVNQAGICWSYNICKYDQSCLLLNLFLLSFIDN